MGFGRPARTSPGKAFEKTLPLDLQDGKAGNIGIMEQKMETTTCIWLVFKSQVPKFGRGKHPRGGGLLPKTKKSPLMKQLSHKDDTAQSPRSHGFRTSAHLESNTAKGCG